jgi:hypothetical protein
MYNKHTWVAPKGTHLNRFTKENETQTSVDLIQNPLLTNVPTPISVEWLNEMEEGILDAHSELSRMEEGILEANLNFSRIDSRYGFIEMSLVELTTLELATMRLLPLEGQVIYIPSYQRLCDRMYSRHVGDSKNATAEWWYKISNQNDKNSRDINGQYMVVLDARAMFLRAAGQNSYYRTDMNDPMSLPYDGKGIGTFGQDTVQNHRHNTNWGGTPEYQIVIENRWGAGLNYYNSAYPSGYVEGARVGYETAPASISVLLLISY